MKQDFIQVNKHYADAIQAEAELRRMEADVSKNTAMQQLDNELGLSKKRAEFQNRLGQIRQTSREEFQKTMKEFKNDWETFKTTAHKKFEKAGRVNDAHLDLLNAQLDGLDARIEYFFGKVVETDAEDADRIRQALQTVKNGLSGINSKIKDAISQGDEQIEQNLSALDQELQDYAREADKIMEQQSDTGSGQTRH